VIWFLTDPARLNAEVRAVEALAAGVDWLIDLDWSFDQGHLVLRFTITVGDRRYDLKMSYPGFFPATPPSVAPVDGELRISPHQYGAGGDLCLEYRPDTWEPRFTGADVIESAHRLISIEHPAEGEPQRVRSAHSVTRGQELRGKARRFLVTADFREFVREMPEDVPVRCEVRLFSFPSRSMAAVVEKLALADGSEWKTQGVPSLGYMYRGILVRISTADLLGLTGDASGSVARQLRNVHADGMQPPLTSYEDREFIIATDGADMTLFWQLSAEKDEISQFATLEIDDDRRRLPETYDVLAEKKVAVVGCGSVGSKMATSLARSGLGQFILVDDDILIRSNLVRNDLDWRSMGEHKAEGLAARLRMINRAAVVQVKRSRLGGQEAAGSAASLLSEIAGCDLIVDATADPRAFNLLSSVATGSKKPMVWCEVFAGGIGGLVARHRPGADHLPQTMRAILRSWFRDQGVPWDGANAIVYGAIDSAGTPLVADDGDVSVIAAHATRMAVDLLVDGDGFPHSMYVLALKKGWKFEQPFEAYPVEGSEPFVAEAPPAVSDDDVNEAAEFIVQLVGKTSNEAPPARQD
jgi:sulfur-carrier protein adenylyltransferase/sulfurtransferase